MTKNSEPVVIIGEAGVNHNGDLARAEALIEAGARAGVDYVKFQTFSADRLVAIDGEKAAYQKARTGETETQYEMLKQLELGAEAHEVLIAKCKQVGLGFLSTAFDLESLDYLQGLGIAFFKVPSGEITNVPYLRRIGSYGKPVVLSTGMATLGEIDSALNHLRVGGSTEITVLHCTTDYPTAFGDVNLRAMCTMKDAFGLPVGYSDHTLGTEVSIAAVALGARVIEKHFTMDRSLPGPDHAASLEPDELAELVSGIRNIETALGDGVKRPRPREDVNRVVARKRIVALRNISENELFTEENLTAMRPETGISVAHWDLIIGKRAARSYRAGEPIEL